MTEAKLFKVGGSQAVRLPKAFRFEGERVRIRREGRAVILEPVERSPADVRAWLESIRIPDFAAEGRRQPMPQDRLGTTNIREFERVPGLTVEDWTRSD